MDEIHRSENSIERRFPADRRCRRLQAFLYQFFKARRVGERRMEYAGAHHYVDVHEAGILLIILLILMMCIADSYMTLTLLTHGGRELNPAMRVLIEYDVGWFFYTKYIVTAAGLIILLMHKNLHLFGSVSGYQILVTVLFVYALLISYEIGVIYRANLPLMI
jgi:hypothetical protein